MEKQELARWEDAVADPFEDASAPLHPLPPCGVVRMWYITYNIYIYTVYIYIYITYVVYIYIYYIFTTYISISAYIDISTTYGIYINNIYKNIWHMCVCI